DIAVEFYSVSKTYSMAGWRIGWICGNSRVVDALNTVKENIDSGQFNAIQNACAFAIENHDVIVPNIRLTFKRRADIFVKTLSAYGWKVFKPQGSCFIWAKPPININSLEACEYILQKTGVLLAPGDGFGRYGRGYLRISTTETDEKINLAISKLTSINWRDL
ncbi:MAG: aminotransferase class I/II-fold pyridoxal phosphate-dependent enzyme, partial [Elusimicrobiales bacterium]|nr:aminotransferase class I/II-fold pyridoxal phosphate-dependent enzyme [Elusimicrobiales bacterium]